MPNKVTIDVIEQFIGFSVAVLGLYLIPLS
jgi:hypothetical protein